VVHHINHTNDNIHTILNDLLVVVPNNVYNMQLRKQTHTDGGVSVRRSFKCAHGRRCCNNTASPLFVCLLLFAGVVVVVVVDDDACCCSLCTTPPTDVNNGRCNALVPTTSINI
jgi:hypothetical protein